MTKAKDTLQSTSGKTQDGKTVKSMMPSAYGSAIQKPSGSGWKKWYDAALVRLARNNQTAEDIRIITAIIKFSNDVKNNDTQSIAISDILSDSDDNDQSTFADTIMRSLERT